MLSYGQLLALAERRASALAELDRALATAALDPEDEGAVSRIRGTDTDLIEGVTALLWAARADALAGSRS